MEREETISDDGSAHGHLPRGRVRRDETEWLPALTYCVDGLAALAAGGKWHPVTDKRLRRSMCLVAVQAIQPLEAQFDRCLGAWYNQGKLIVYRLSTADISDPSVFVIQHPRGAVARVHWGRQDPTWVAGVHLVPAELWSRKEGQASHIGALLSRMF